MKKLFYIAMSLLAVTLVACNGDDEVGEVDLGYLPLISSDVNFDYLGGTGEIVVDTDSPVTAVFVEACDWAELSVAGSVVSVTASKYSGLQIRNVGVKVSADGRSVVVPVSQMSPNTTFSSSLLIFEDTGSQSVSFKPVDITITATESDKPWVTADFDNTNKTITVSVIEDVGSETAFISVFSDEDMIGKIEVVMDSSWEPWAVGIYSEAEAMGDPVEIGTRTLSKRKDENTFRIEDAYVDGYHYVFEWDIDNLSTAITPVGLPFDMYGLEMAIQFTGMESNGNPVVWGTELVDNFGGFIFYDPEGQYFQINSIMDEWDGTDIVNGGYFTDNFFEITEFLQGNPWNGGGGGPIGEPGPLAYEDAIGSYTGKGVPAFLTSPGPSTWQGEIADPGDGGEYYTVTNSFGGTNYSFFDFADGKLYLDNYYDIAENQTTNQGAVVNVRVAGIFEFEGNYYSLQPDSYTTQLLWYPDSRTIEYPKELNFGGNMGVQKMMYGLAGFTVDTGQFAAVYSELYEDLTLTVDSGSNVFSSSLVPSTDNSQNISTVHQAVKISLTKEDLKNINVISDKVGSKRMSK